jgi:hypothetical protein
MGHNLAPLGLIQFEVRSGLKRGPEYEAQTVYGRTDHRDFERTLGRRSGRRSFVAAVFPSVKIKRIVVGGRTRRFLVGALAAGTRCRGLCDLSRKRRGVATAEMFREAVRDGHRRRAR